METAPPPWKVTRRGTFGWVLYDLANTIFALGVSGLYFPLWVVTVQRWPDSAISVSTATAMTLVIVTAPWIGARSDHRGRRLPYLRRTTLLAVGATLLIAEVPVPPSLVLFVLALVGFHLGSVIYDALLPDVGAEQGLGRISGLGAGVGYLGSFLAVGAGTLVRDAFGYPAVFKTLALLFLLFATPAFFLIGERPRPTRSGPPPRAWAALAQLIRSWRKAAGYRGIVRFLVGRFLYTDAINTVILFLAVFAVEEIGFTTGQVEILLPVAISGAVVGGLVTGRVVDRVGPRRALHGILYLWMAALAVGLVAAPYDLQLLAWGLGAAGGFALGGMGASDRVYMARISPPAAFGEFYGLYATVGRFATVLGPLVWGLMVDLLGLGRLAAMATLLAFLVAARLVLQGVDDRPRPWTERDRGA